MMAALKAVLPRSTSVVFQRRETSNRIFKIAGRRARVLWNSTGWPTHIEEALHNVTADLVVAPYLSPGARKLLQHKSIGWLDESGAAEFTLGTIVVSRTGVHQKRKPKQSER